MGREAVPVTLEGRVRAALAAEDERAAPPIASLVRHPMLRHAAALALCCALSVLLTIVVVRQSGNEVRLEQDVVSAHVRVR